MKIFTQFLEFRKDIWTLWRQVLATKGEEGLEEFKRELTAFTTPDPDYLSRIPMFFDSLEKYFSGESNPDVVGELEDEIKFLTKTRA